jgi:transcriptional regulator with XRE-family HTH domain
VPSDLPQWLAEERKAVGGRLFVLRHQRGLSQERLAERAGMSPKTVSRIETGVVSATVDQLARLARGLGVPTWRLFWGD